MYMYSNRFTIVLPQRAITKLMLNNIQILLSITMSHDDENNKLITNELIYKVLESFRQLDSHYTCCRSCMLFLKTTVNKIFQWMIR